MWGGVVGGYFESVGVEAYVEKQKNLNVKLGYRPRGENIKP